MKMNAKLPIACCLLLTSTLSVEGQRKEIFQKPMSSLEKQVSILMADRGVTKGVALEKIIEMEDLLLEEEEDLLFPADELYGSNWDTRWVDPFRADTTGITFPDSCEIDCSSFIMPINNTLKITSRYGPRRRRMHRGIDLKLQIGDTVYAAFAGKVRIRNTERRGYGKYLVIRHANGLETIYGHLSDWIVETNDIVKAGDPIGLGGNTGRSTGSHLHFETRLLGQAIDPAEIIDFDNGEPYRGLFVFHNVKINGKNSNIYTSSEDQIIFHLVKSGDTLGAIARRYGTTIGELCRLNGLKTTSMLRIGQSIRCGIGKTKNVKPTNATIPVKQATPATPAKSTAANNATSPVYHKIQSGDTLSAIAAKHGTTVSRLCELNAINKTTVLRLGRSLRCS
ncbi:MAG: peptidoglycan DD-metalloendopeptidase family protein [Tannerellaceae bacterium]|nr:peptidoglycan DD-metalloendopeptidase family protein [Tannerellaceae bacterium]